MDFGMQRIRKMGFIYFSASLFFLNFENLSAMNDFMPDDDDVFISDDDSDGVLMRI